MTDVKNPISAVLLIVPGRMPRVTRGMSWKAFSALLDVGVETGLEFHGYKGNGEAEAKRTGTRPATGQAHRDICPAAPREPYFAGKTGDGVKNGYSV